MKWLRYAPLRYVITAVTVFLVVDWLRLPAELAAAPAETATYAVSYQPDRNDRVVLERDNARSLYFSCRKLPALCKAAQVARLPDVQLDIVEPSVWQGRWVRQASVAGRVIVAAANQEILFSESRTIQIWLSVFFVVFSALLWGVSILSPSASPHEEQA
ncbi:hypothetical protein [Viridibacterium curvum]|uniref:Uncharacterized protein n=1 Tax=Viridibacterium curvum TaxID=1101404 RepID=A0ABP9QL45_9RHOO